MRCAPIPIIIAFDLRIQRNGNSYNGGSGPTQGILKTRKPMVGTKVFAINSGSFSYNALPIGTMRADEEANLRQMEKTRPAVKTSDGAGFTNFAVMKANTGRNFTTGKLGNNHYHRRSRNYH